MKITPPILLLLLVGCPSPPDDLDPVVCDEGYYLCGPDSQDCCMDSTSHEFTWVLDTIGSHGGDLRDAAIINENDIWIVGRIRVEEVDSSGENTQLLWYNAVHWDGSEWSLHVAYDNTTLKNVFAFGPDDVWFVNGEDIIHFDGSTFKRLWHAGYGQFNQVITIWGTSSENVYFAGHDGTIIHYDGSGFTRDYSYLESNFSHITGSSNGAHVFVAGSSELGQSVDIILHSGSSLFAWEKIKYPLNSLLGFDPPDLHGLAVIGDILYIPKNLELWKYNIVSKGSRLDSEIDHIEKKYNFVGGESENDIVFGGSKFDYLHYNGSSYQYVDAIQQDYKSIYMSGGDFKDGIAVMVGTFDTNVWPAKALVALGHRE